MSGLFQSLVTRIAAIWSTLAASGGSALIGFMQNGIGAILLTVQNKLKQSVSIDDFGADKTGSADCASAILAAINSGAKRVLADPKGTYSVSSVAIPSNIELDFCGATVIARTASAFVFTNNAYAAGSNSNITLKNMVIDGNKGSIASVKGVAVQRVSGFTMENVLVKDCGLNGIYIGTTSAAINLQKCKVSGCGDNSPDTFEGMGINILGGTADFPNSVRVLGVTLDNCEVTDSWCHGFVAQFADNVTVLGGRYHANGRGRLIDPLKYYSNGMGGGQVYGFQVIGVAAYDNKESGFDIAAKSQGVEIVGCVAHNNVLDGIFSGHITSRNYTITGNTVRANGRHGINLSDTIFNVVLSGNACLENGQDGITMDACSAITVANNACYANGRYGIYTAATAHQINVATNTCFSNATADFSISSSLTSVAANYNRISEYLASLEPVARFNRLGNFGPMMQIAKDGTLLGDIGHDGSEMSFNNSFGIATTVKNKNSGLFIYDDAGANRFIGMGVDNVINLGRAGWRFATVYAGTGTINTSDEREKQQWLTNLAPELRAWSKVEFGKFKFNDAVAAKGDKSRWHFGVIAQRVKEAFESEGLDPFAYGVLCYDEWQATKEVIDEDGHITQQAKPEGNRYGVRYEEAFALECAYLRSRIK